MELPELIAACNERESLPFLLIGGHAVIAHGYSRFTYDIDFLIRKADRGRWVAWLSQRGYSVGAESESFVRLMPNSGDVKLDLMLVNDATFDGMWQHAKRIEMADQSTRIPMLDHLIALKLHVLKQNLSHRAVKDMNDVIHLVLANSLDVSSDHYQQLFAKYGNAELHKKVLKATRSDSVD